MPIDQGMRRFAAWLAVGMAVLAVLPACASAAAGANPGQARAEKALQRVQDLHNGIGVRTGRELTPALVELQRTKRALDAPGRRKADALLARPTDGPADPQGDGYTTTEATPSAACTSAAITWRRRPTPRR